MSSNSEDKRKRRFVLEVSGPEDLRPGDGDNWFWQVGPDSDGIIDEMMPIFAPHLVSPVSPPPPEEPEGPTDATP